MLSHDWLCTGGALTSCKISPDITLLTGLQFNKVNCAIDGTPTRLSSVQTYTVTASNNGNPAVSVPIRVDVVAVKPYSLSYSPRQFIYSLNDTIGTFPTPTYGGDLVISYSIYPDLPEGLVFDNVQGKISGKPLQVRALTSYTVTASNTGGSAHSTISIQVRGLPPAGLSYGGTANSSFELRKSKAFSLQPSLNASGTMGGGVVLYSARPSVFPAGITLNPDTGEISGTPLSLTWPAEDFIVTAANSGGNTSATVSIAVIDEAPSDLQYVLDGSYPVSESDGYKFTLQESLTSLKTTNQGCESST